MRLSTLKYLRCVRPAAARGPKKGPKTACPGALSLEKGETGPEIRAGWLQCQACQARYPILAGVAVVVPSPRDYVLFHVKGISAVVPDAEIPREWRREFVEAREELAEIEHEETDLESQRIVALYFMNHYLSVAGGAGGADQSGWWKPRAGEGSPLVDALVREYWDRGPMARIGSWIAEGAPQASVVEFGCGVGGLGARLGRVGFKYLGLDSSFASVALGRHILLGVPYAGRVAIPEDLLQGTLSREVDVASGGERERESGGRLGDTGAGSRGESGGEVDLVVADFESPPVSPESFDVCVAMNTTDMLEDPRVLPAMQKAALKKGGIAIQSCPYIWRDDVARRLRAWFPKSGGSSSRAVEQMYAAAGLELEEAVEHLPWLFFKHVRQLEIYSVHLLRAVKK